MTLYGADPYVPSAGDGASGVTLPGSGFAVPAGLEAILEYNGLFLNVQSNYDRYKVTGIDGLGDSDIRDTRDVNTDGDGEVPFSSFLGGRTIVISGTIQTYSVAKLRDMQQALRAAFADTTVERPLFFRTGDFNKDHLIYCKKISPLAMVEQQSNLSVSRDFQISVRASNPRFMSYYSNFYDSALDPSLDSPSPFGTIINRGNYWSEPIYRIYGPTTSMQILNETTDRSFTVTNIGTGHYVDFDTANKTLIDPTLGNQWNSLSDDSDYVYLQGVSGENPTGENVLFYQGDAPRVEVSWRDSWV